MNDEDIPQLQPLSTILELNCAQARDGNDQNSEYTSVLTEGRTIMPGGTLSAKLTTINSKKNNSGDIVVPDLPIYFTFSYVDMDCCTASKTELVSGDPWPAPTFQYYAGYIQVDLIELIKVKVTYTGPQAGPFSYAEATFSWIDVNGKQQNNLNSPYVAPIIGAGPVEIDLGTDTNIQFRSGTLQLILLNGRNAVDPTVIIPPTDFIYDPEEQPPDFQQVIQQLGTQLHTKVFNIPREAVPPGAYDPGELANRLTQVIADSGGTDPNLNLWIPRNPLLTRMDNYEQDNTVVWRQCFEPNGNAIVFNDANSYQYATNYSIQKGAQLASIEYGKVGNVFQLSALHSPVYNPASPGTKNVAYYHANMGGVIGFYEVPVESKIVIHDFHPPELLDAMGLGGIITPLIADPNGVQGYSLKRMLACTTAENTPIGGFCPNFNPVVVDPVDDQIRYIDTTGLNTKAIIGIPANPDPDPVYLLRITCGLGNISDYVASDTVLNDVAAIVAKEYTSNSITTGYGGDSAVFYTHRGEPKTLQSFTVSIIDVNTKQPVTDLDPNTIIHLQLDNPPPQEPDPVVTLLDQIKVLLQKKS